MTWLPWALSGVLALTSTGAVLLWRSAEAHLKTERALVADCERARTEDRAEYERTLATVRDAMERQRLEYEQTLDRYRKLVLAYRSEVERLNDEIIGCTDPAAIHRRLMRLMQNGPVPGVQAGGSDGSATVPAPVAPQVGPGSGAG